MYMYLFQHIFIYIYIYIVDDYIHIYLYMNTCCCPHRILVTLHLYTSFMDFPGDAYSWKYEPYRFR